jgi:hypothetical protein
MMLLGIFMTTIVIGMLYYLAGVGETITYRERMQDAVDSGAFAGSLLYARAMNVIVLLNMAVASVFAIAVAAYAAIFLLMAAAGAASADCNPPYRWSGCIPALCLMTCAVPQACDNADEKRDIAKDVAENAQRSANAIANATRIAAVGASAEIISLRYRPPVQLGAGIGNEMPLDDEDPTHACEEILAFSGPSGIASLPPDMPILAVSGFAYDIARPYASDCSASNYLNQVAASSILWVYISCYMIRDDIAGRTKKIQDDVNMGGPEFQFRTFAMAQDDALPFEPNQERVELVTWGNEDSSATGGITDFLEEANRFSVAQAEYYFDGDDDRELWTWRLNWRSRLRRFRFGGGGASGCPGFMGTVCDGLNSAVIH